MISSTANTKIRRLENLQKKPKVRQEEGVFVAEGLRMALEAPGKDIREIFVSESFRDKEKSAMTQITDKCNVRPEIISDSVFARVSDTQTPQGILLVLTQKQYTLKNMIKTAGKNPLLLLILENIQDPGNLGTMFRSAEAAGATGVILSRDSVDIYNPKVIRSTMGSVFRLPFIYVEDLPAMIRDVKKQGVRIFAADLSGTEDYDQENYRNSCAFLVGNEGNGLTESALSCADTCVRIPMQGQVESLNAAVAGALLLYEADRQRRGEAVRKRR